MVVAATISSKLVSLNEENNFTEKTLAYITCLT